MAIRQRTIANIRTACTLLSSGLTTTEVGVKMGVTGQQIRTLEGHAREQFPDLYRKVLYSRARVRLIRPAFRPLILTWLSAEGYKRCPACSSVKCAAWDFSPRSRQCKRCCADRAIKSYYRNPRKREAAKKNSKLQSQSGYSLWYGILSRCYSPTCRAYKDYGGRGIQVYPEWRSSFKAFREYIGPRPSKKHSVDRINNDGNYEPGNVRWANPKEQSRNKRTSHILNVFGKVFCVAEWAERSGLKPKTIERRLERGWDVESTLTTPPRAPRGSRDRLEVNLA